MERKEILEAAERGDVKAMVQMAEHYLHLDVEEALKWAQLAGKRHHANGAYLAALCKRTQARTACAFDGDTAMEKILGFYTWSQRALALYWSNADGSEELSEEQLLGLCEEAAFERGYRLYMDGNREGAITVLKRESSYRNRLLLGVCLLDWYRENKDAVEEDLLAACEYLSEIKQVHPSGQKEDVHTEQLYTDCALRFSEIQRMGIWPFGAKPSPRAAVETLRRVRSVVREKHCVEILNKELSRYEKILFGKYIYIG